MMRNHYQPDVVTWLARRTVRGAIAVTVATLSVLVPLGPATLVDAQEVDCQVPGRHTPAVPVPECVDSDGFATDCSSPLAIRLWPNDFRPMPSIPLIRDSTDRIAGLTIPGREKGHELFSELDILTVNGVSRRLYVSYNSGLQVWSIEGEHAADPLRLDTRDGWPRDNGNIESAEFLSFPKPDEVLSYVQDIAAVNVSSTVDLVSLAANDPVGMSIWTFNTSAKNFTQHYQDPVIDAKQTNIVKMNDGVVYAFAGASNGLSVYNATTARALPTPCLDDGENCPGIRTGFVGNTENETRIFIDTLHVPAGDRVFVTASGGIFTDLELWQVSDPQNPGTALLRFSGMRHSLGSAIFEYDGHYYVAVVTEETGLNKERLKIFLIDDCINGGSCTFEQAVNDINVEGFATTKDFLTFSEFDGNPFLYYGAGTGNLDGPDLEKLFDLSALRPPNPSPLGLVPEITASGGSYIDPCNGSQIRYWSHYYHSNAQGLNNTSPRAGMFSTAGYFYRVNSSILDVHLMGEGGGTGGSGIRTEVTTPQNQYWMSDVIAFDATGTGDCDPSALSWDWAGSTNSADVVATQVVAGTDTSSYRFDCVAVSGRCADAAASVEASNGACPEAEPIPAEIAVKDPEIDIASTDTGGRSNYERCEIIPLSANLVGRGPAYWEWRLNDVAIPDCSGSHLAADLETADAVNCTLDGELLFTPEIFLDGFERGDLTRWRKVVPAPADPDKRSPRVSEKGAAGTPATVELLVWDNPDTSTTPRSAADVNFTLAETGTPAFVGSPSETVDGPSATLLYPAADATTWTWEFEDPEGEDTCTFPTKPSVTCAVETTSESAITHVWPTPGNYTYRVTVSNCGPDSDTAVDDVTVESGIQPVVEIFNVKNGIPSAGCCGNLVSGFRCNTGAAAEFQVQMKEDGPYAFAFDWDRTSEATTSFTSQTPTGNSGTTITWFFTHIFTEPGMVYPIVRVTSGGLTHEWPFIKVPLEIGSNVCGDVD